MPIARWLSGVVERQEKPAFEHAHSWLDDELGFTFWWDVRKLWEIQLPIVAMPVHDLEWLLELPFWDDRPQDLAVSGRDVAAHPERHPVEYHRTMAADLGCPINVIWLKDRWVIMDGLHRLLKASLLGHDTILAKQAFPCDVPNFSREWWEPHNHPAPPQIDPLSDGDRPAERETDV